MKELDNLARDAIAAQRLGLSYGHYKVLHPHTAEAEDEPPAPEEWDRKDRIPVIATCVNSGETRYYFCIKDAERDGFCHNNVGRCIAGRQATHKGWRFRRATVEEIKKNEGAAV